MRVNKLLVGAIAPLTAAVLFAPGQVSAQGQSASAAAMLEEVVVTARRREESLLDLPLSIAAITADAMQAQGIYNIADVGDFVPNLAFTTTDRRHRKAMYIRGIGNDSPGSLQPVGAGLYLDGHYMPNTVGQMLATVDIERIEVLRGPQGTLFGKNTTGGAVNIISAKPQDQFEADLIMRVGDYGRQDLRGMINVPFSDTAFGRFSVAKETSDGYYYNRTLKTNIGATDLTAFGGALRFQPDDNWTIDLSTRMNIQNDDDEGGQCRPHPQQAQVDRLANKSVDASDTALAGYHPAQVYTGPVYADGIKQWGGSTKYADGKKRNIGGHLERMYPGATIDFWNICAEDNRQGTYVNSQEKDTFLELDNKNFNATVTWDSAGEVGGLDNLEVKMIASTHSTRWNYIQDRDMSSLPIDAIGTPPLHGQGQERKTQNFELLFTGDVSDRMGFVVGAHLFGDTSLTGEGGCLNIFNKNFSKFDEHTVVNGAKVPTAAALALSIPCEPDGGTQFDRMADRQVPGGPGIAGMSGRMENDSKAIFGHLTYDISDDWTLDLGARWTTEDRMFNQAEIDAVASTCSHKGAGDPPITSICRPDYILSYESVISEGFYNNTTATFDAVTPMASLTRNIGEESMVYFLYAEGFLSGSFNDELNTTKVPELAPLLTYNPEYVSNYEMGYKTTFADGRVRLSTSAFYMDYTDKQEGISVDNHDGKYGGDPQISIVTNAATVDIYGIEVELRAQVWDGGFFSLDVGHLTSKYGQFTSFDPDAAGGTIDQSESTIQDYSPEWTINASIHCTNR